ncbi:T9SS type A sorting domain-containing protein [bacterium]|nr:T9SS type A sorting domain-containing protein [bacterium]
MKRLFLVLLMGVTMVLGQITSIYDIQYVADPETDDASPLLGQTVTISGVVTGEYWGTYNNRTMYIQDAEGPWCGIYGFNYSDDGWRDVDVTYDPGVMRTTVVEGDSVTVTGVVDEYYNVTELLPTSLVVHGLALNPPAPMLLTPAEAAMEQYEGCLVTFEDVTVDDPDEGNGEWSFTDGTTSLSTNDVWGYYYYPKTGAEIASITGVMEWTYGARKVLPRLARDIVQAGEFTRVQRIQQVLGSSLYMLPDSAYVDASYFVDDTVSCIGIVTVPTAEISGWDTTGGILTGYSRFVWQDPNGGPYSAILSYFNDASAFPELYIGDSINITGYIFEYAGGGGPAAFTEMFITEPVSIVGITNIPDRPLITTGELQNPLTAEQWENNVCRIENAIMINNDLPYGEFMIDDGSGPILSDADATNSMSGYDVYGNYVGGEFIRPPNGTTFASIEGYVYHAYGSFADNTTYSIRAFTPSDIILGGGPPAITDFSVTLTDFGVADAVTVSANMVDGSAVASAVVTYRVDGGTWTDVAMTLGEGDLWSGTIPATNTEGALVEYYLMAADDGEDNQPDVMTTMFPSDTTIATGSLLGYHTQAAGPSIADLQYSPFDRGNSYYVQSVVTASGIVTGFDEPAAAGGLFSFQSEATMGYGILCVDASDYVPTRGDHITVTGLLVERYDEATAIINATTTVNSSGNTEQYIVLTGADLVADPEGYESNSVSLGAVSVTSINSYDWTVNDGTGDFLIDDDWLISDSPADLAINALEVGGALTLIKGVWNHSYATYKVQIRDLVDMGLAVGIDDGIGIPNQFSLSQNYPNPFNPATTIEYSLAQPGNHTLQVFDLRGALVTTLVDKASPAGAYSVTWNASSHASGLYFLRLNAQDLQQTRKLILIK